MLMDIRTWSSSLTGLGVNLASFVTHKSRENPIPLDAIGFPFEPIGITVGATRAREDENERFAEAPRLNPEAHFPPVPQVVRNDFCRLLPVERHYTRRGPLNLDQEFIDVVLIIETNVGTSGDSFCQVRQSDSKIDHSCIVFWVKGFRRKPALMEQ